MNSDRALELAREAFPHNHILRVAFMLGCNKGYEEAEKDLTLTWEDMKLIDELFTEMAFSEPNDSTEWYQELANRFNEQRNK